MANISELSSGQGNVDVEGTNKEFGEPRVFSKFGKELKVVTVVLEDDSGNIKLTLWNDDADKFKQGDKVKITNGYVNEFQGEPQLTSGKFGKIEMADGNAPAEEAPSEKAEAEAPAEGAEESETEEPEAEEPAAEPTEEPSEEPSAEAPVEETEEPAEESEEKTEETVI